MSQINKILLSALIAISLALVACGDSDNPISDKGESAQTYIKATIVDGYLKNAEVFLDINGNYIADADEPRATSGIGGLVNLDVTGIENVNTHPLVVNVIKGVTIDEDTGAAVTHNYAMSSPAGKLVVTPLTTLVQAKIEQGHTL
jgi:hypothetical protein